MTLNLSVPGQNDLRPRISVFGIGGAGGNAVNNMIEKKLEGAEFVAANTDAQALQQSNAKNKIQMGVKVTEGLGAGARASVGAAAAEETIEEIVDHLAGSHMAFITAGMGGGTGTGAAPIIAQAARELGVLTVGVVTKPFQFEGAKRMRQAEEGVEAEAEEASRWPARPRTRPRGSCGARLRRGCRSAPSTTHRPRAQPTILTTASTTLATLAAC